MFEIFDGFSGEKSSKKLRMKDDVFVFKQEFRVFAEEILTLLRTRFLTDNFEGELERIRIGNEMSKLRNDIEVRGLRMEIDETGAFTLKPPFSGSETKEEGQLGLNTSGKNLAQQIPSHVSNIRKPRIQDAFTDFRDYEHRLEKVAHIKNVDFVNDSKSTNVHQAWFALESINEPVIWIMGGVDKGNDYTMLTKLVRQKVKYIITLGEDVNKIHKAFKHHVDMILQTNNMEEAVKMAYHFSSPGDCILLSPACPSFDLFEDYQDRGRQFKEAVKTLS